MGFFHWSELGVSYAGVGTSPLPVICTTEDPGRLANSQINFKPVLKYIGVSLLSSA